MSDDEKPKWADLFGIDPDWPVTDHERENHALRRILTDLIEHLRAWERSQRTDPVHNPDYLAWMADHAETRLREVQA